MRCPFCQTDNREDRETCYACGKNISMLRLVVNKARHHFNTALEHAERGRHSDAMLELRNALDLDKRFSSAHVVLGTLHAKRGEFEEARKCWEAALALNPDLQRAHQYIDKLETVERALPAMVRWRRWALGAGVLAALCAALMVYLVLSAPAVHLLNEASSAMERKDFGKALVILDEIESKSDWTGAARFAVDGLRQSVRSSLAELVAEVRQLKYENNYPRALARISEIERNGVDFATSITLSDIRQDISHYYRQQIEVLFEEYQENRVPLTTLADRIQDYLSIYPDVPERAEITGFLEKARETEAARAITTLRKDIPTLGALGTLDTLRRINQRFPGSQAVAEGRKGLIEAILDFQISEFSRFMDEKQFGQAREILTQMNEMRDEFRHVLDRNDPIEYAEESLATEQRNEWLRMAERAIARGDLADAGLLLSDIGFDPSLSPAERQLVERAIESLELRHRNQDISVLRELLPRLRQNTQTAAETTRALQRISMLMSSLAALPIPPVTEPRTPEILELTEAVGAGLAAAVRARRLDLANSIETYMRSLIPEGVRSPLFETLSRQKNQLEEELRRAQAETQAREESARLNPAPSSTSSDTITTPTQAQRPTRTAPSNRRPTTTPRQQNPANPQANPAARRADQTRQPRQP